MIYSKYIKRILDFIISLVSLIVISPIFIILIVLGTIAMQGNPFFVQERPGKIDKNIGKEKIFKLIKFRTMSNAKDKSGKLLPDKQRLNRYGRILRLTSMDELGELINILKGDMSFVGPRPLLVEYLPYYSEEEHKRHEVRPGLTGLAQINGRNNIRCWEDRFKFDLEYVKNISFSLDMKIIFTTVGKVVKKSDILVGDEIKVGRLDDARKSSKY